ncbi:MAG: tRNA (adenosine(37)-N6)-threonylcarbamoyltransferase complex ATPase subunit type 1 TsaE [Gammaproteobacteria bacterium]|jgi:tRNA threonylcarbamoyladenosine biosynthesis protein TsaE|nr:tRNA (adenosine(37)-N6)-threonylcarbamoyltransferase complex ATPase subunit type 1 TsaE [Gammaproteobacteria bacterium]
MSERQRVKLPSADATEAVGKRLAIAVAALAPVRFDIHLRGDLGAGKTTCARGFLAGLGHRDRVPSPTYTLVEPYEFDAFTVYHADLYRLRGAAEVAYLGLHEPAGDASIWLIEWPENGGEALDPADLTLSFEIADPGRWLQFGANSDAGCSVLEAFDLG